MNKKYAFGIPTFVHERATGTATSIIDFGLMNNTEILPKKAFWVGAEAIGNTLHSAHRPILCCLNTNTVKSEPDLLQKPFLMKFAKLRAEDREEYNKQLHKFLVEEEDDIDNFSTERDALDTFFNDFF